MLILIIAFVVAQTADTHIVNIENARMQSDRVGWQGGVGMAISLTQNTARIFSLGGETHL